MSPGTGSSARRAGHEFERDVARYLGVRTTRSMRPGIRDDAGDLVVDQWLLELKNHGRVSDTQILRWAEAATVKAAMAGLRHTAVIVKARNRPLATSRVYLTARSLMALMDPSVDLADLTVVAIDLYAFRSHLTLRGVLP